MKGKLCELCSNEAILYCESDSAYLCYSCDSRAHQANFIVARHIRRTLCSKCKDFSGDIVSGGKLDIFQLSPTCTSCVHVASSPCSSSSSSTCVSSTTSVDANSLKKKTAHFDNPARLRPERVECKTFLDMKAEAIFVNWSRKLGLNSNVIVPLASTAFGLSLKCGSSSTLPFRLRLAGSFGLALRLCNGKSKTLRESLKAVEMLSHVPGKLILAAESKVVAALRDIKKRQSCKLKEGWAESCV